MMDFPLHALSGRHLMYLDYLVPSWHEIESRVIAMVGYPSGGQFRTSLNEEVASLGLNLRRIEAVRTAFYHAEWQAAHLLRSASPTSTSTASSTNC
jgi:hypothetical protein